MLVFQKFLASACLAERARPPVQGFHLMQMHRRSADPRRDSESPLKHPHPKHTCTYIHIHALLKNTDSMSNCLFADMRIFETFGLACGSCTAGHFDEHHGFFFFLS